MINSIKQSINREKERALFTVIPGFGKSPQIERHILPMLQDLAMTN